MNFYEIREKVNQINTALDQAVSQFILNDTAIQKLHEELNDIQTQCSHNFIDGHCIYCDVEDKKNV